MERIAALVEGQTEHHFVKKTYANSVIQRPFPNGKDVPIEVITECLLDAIETLGGDISKVLVLLDREGRAESADAMRTAIGAALVTASPNRSFYVGVTDRHIENWILADEDFVRGTFGQPSYVYLGDGTKGKPALDDVSNKSLRSPTEKAEMLKACSALKGQQLSPSLAAFCATVNFDWYWIGK
jgi:hypothetical protein